MSILSNKVRVATMGVTVAAMSLIALPAAAVMPSANRFPPETRSHDVGSGTGQPSKQENIGVFTGLAVGAAAAGPIGAMVGMVAGAWLGDRYHRESAANQTLATQNHDLAASLGHTEQERAALAGKLSLASQSLAATEAQRAQLDRTVQLSDDIETDVAFRTNDASIHDLQLPALRKLGALAAALPPGAKVRIDGYADPRGPAALNDDLSLRRAEAVARALGQAGVPQDRLVIDGHGASDSTSPRGDLDAYAFDRRVTVRLERLPTASAASADAGLSGAGARRDSEQPTVAARQ